jgi:ABC-2 type transport system ATP-binding protein
MSIISINNLVKKYDNMHALKGITFDVGHGEIFALLGPNGSGKTTTLEILMGLKSFDEGDIQHFDLAGKAKSKFKVGPVFQTPVYYENLTVKELFKYYCKFYSTPTTRLTKYLDMVNLTEKLDCQFKELSGGQKQQLSIVLSLVNEPDLLFFDEPSNALDPQVRQQIWALIRSLKEEGRTIVFTTHYIEEAEALADRVAILNHGKILITDTPQRIIQDFNESYIVELALEQPYCPEALAQLGVTNAKLNKGVFSFTVNAIDGDILQKVKQLSEQCAIAKFSIGKSSLEDVFVKLTSQGSLS